MSQNDINSIPPRDGRFDMMDAEFARNFRLLNAAREQTIRDLARPYLDAGYVPAELAIVQRRDNFPGMPDETFLCVEVHRRRSNFRLWWRRTMRWIGIYNDPTNWRCSAWPV